MTVVVPAWREREDVPGKCRFTLGDAMRYVSETEHCGWMLPEILLYNKSLRKILREAGPEAFLEEIRLLRPDDVRIMGHTFHGLQDIQNSVEKRKRDNCSIVSDSEAETFPHVGMVYGSYPCFDFYDSMNETRTYQNYIFRRDKITDDDIIAAYNIRSLGNCRRLHEHTPKDMLPMVYYNGDGDYMLVAEGQ